MPDRLINEILNQPEFEKAPPVLIDIGASGGYHRSWLPFASASICLAFDADERKFGVVESNDTRFKKLYIFHSLVSERDEQSVPFYLTESPFCSSLLEPDTNALRPWGFASKFETVKTLSLPATSLTSALKQINVDYVDWFKADTQGIDLRLFDSLPRHIRDAVIAVELEPGIIDSYKGEDKLHEVLKYFDTGRFWLSELIVKGFPRLSETALRKSFNSVFLRKLGEFSHRQAPGWGEMFFLNTLTENVTRRQLLLGCAVALSRCQFGFALEISGRGMDAFSDALFEKIHRYAMKRVKISIAKISFFPAFIQKIQKMIFERY